MRISDWSSDVCSSDLRALPWRKMLDRRGEREADRFTRLRDVRRIGVMKDVSVIKVQGHPRRLAARQAGCMGHRRRPEIHRLGDRTRVVEGKSVSVRVDIGGRRMIQKKKKERKK